MKGKKEHTTETIYKIYKIWRISVGIFRVQDVLLFTYESFKNREDAVKWIYEHAKKRADYTILEVFTTVKDQRTTII